MLILIFKRHLLRVTITHLIVIFESMKCKNCGNHVTDKYCAHCGQTAAIERLSLKELLLNFWDVFTHAEHGIFNAAKLLFIKPAYITKEYLSGKRKKYFSPIKYLIVVVTLSAIFILNYSRLGLPFEPAFPKDSKIDDIVEEDYFNHKNYKTQLFLSIPLASLISWLVFRKSGFNYAENIVLNTYLLSQVILVHTIAVMPSLIIASDTVDQWLIAVYLLVSLVYVVWAYVSFFPGEKAGKFVKAILTVLIFSFLYNTISHYVHKLFS